MKYYQIRSRMQTRLASTTLLGKNNTHDRTMYLQARRKILSRVCRCDQDYSEEDRDPRADPDIYTNNYQLKTRRRKLGFHTPQVHDTPAIILILVRDLLTLSDVGFWIMVGTS